jgi:uncharacterized caspase-like protein
MTKGAAALHAKEALMTRKALLVGLNRYPDPENALRGCLNDVKQMSRMLEDHFGFERSRGIRLLTDRQATTEAIRDGLAWLMDGAAAGDVLVFHYSGHGSQVPDRDGDEQDGLDEIICPYDLDWDHPFSDDDLRDLVEPLAAGANLTVVLDCCHAGTGLRRPANGTRRARCLVPPGRLARPAGERLRRFGRAAAEQGAILIAACADDQVSADAWIEGDYHGALTWYLCDAAVASRYRITYSRLVLDVRHRMRAAGYDQVPQLEGRPALLGQVAFSPFALVAG